MVTTPFRNGKTAASVRREPVIAQGLLADVLIATPEAAGRGEADRDGSSPRSAALNAGASVVDVLQARLHVLVASCTDALDKALQHLEGEDSWVIGPLPNCGPLADDVEAAARAFLTQSHVNARELEVVTEVLKSAGDLRAVARGARQAVQLAHLIRQEPAGREAIQVVLPIGEAALALARNTSDSLAASDHPAARQAALRYRSVDAARQTAEREIRSPQRAALFTPTMVHLVRASLWFLAVSGESMARVAARYAGRTR